MSSLTPPEDLLNAALNLLAARSRGVEELRGRLLKKGFKRKDVGGCLRWLEERGYLDDEAFARAFIRDRIRFSPRSGALLRSELRKKGIDGELAQGTVEEVFDEEGLSEADLGREAARAWVRKQSPDVQRQLLSARFSQEREKARRRLYGYLTRRGFRGDASRAGMEAGEEEAREIRTSSTDG